MRASLAAVRAAAAGEATISPELLARLLPRLARARVHRLEALSIAVREGLLPQR